GRWDHAWNQYAFFDKQADYQLDVPGAATEALHRAVIIRMPSTRLAPVSGTWLAEPETLRTDQGIQTGPVEKHVSGTGRRARGDPVSGSASNRSGMGTRRSGTCQDGSRPFCGSLCARAVREIS